MSFKTSFANFILAFMLVAFSGQFAQAQKVKVKGDQVMVNGDAYCKMETIGMPVRKITLTSLDGDELFFVTDLYVGAIQVKNLQNGETYFIDMFAVTGVKNKLVSLMYNNDVILADGISDEGLKRFLMKYQLTPEEAERKRAEKAESREELMTDNSNNAQTGSSANYTFTPSPGNSTKRDPL